MHPTEAADSVREIAWQRGFPVDPVTIARSLGVNVLETDLPEGVSGALLKEAGKDPVIVVHYRDSDNRKRFTCAHELGHYVSRVESNNEEREYEFIDLRNANSSNGTDKEEIFANQFAAHLLMPENMVRFLSKKHKSHLQMAYFFGVSNEAMKNRLSNLGLL